MNFVFNMFMQALRCNFIDFVSSKVMSADEVEISSSENEYFYSLFSERNNSCQSSLLCYQLISSDNSQYALIVNSEPEY